MSLGWSHRMVVMCRPVQWCSTRAAGCRRIRASNKQQFSRSCVTMLRCHVQRSIAFPALQTCRTSSIQKHGDNLFVPRHGCQVERTLSILVNCSVVCACRYQIFHNLKTAMSRSQMEWRVVIIIWLVDILMRRCQSTFDCWQIAVVNSLMQCGSECR